MTNKEIEKEFCHELGTYAEIAIEDNRTDGDRLMGSLMAALIHDGKVNRKRFESILKEGLEILDGRNG